MRITAWEFCEEWYTVEEIEHYQTRQQRSLLQANEARIPEDVYSRQFAEWFVHNLRLAMQKGIQVGKSDAV